MVGGFTVNVLTGETNPPKLAEMELVPTPTPDAKPPLAVIVATVPIVDVQAAVVVMSGVVPSL